MSRWKSPQAAAKRAAQEAEKAEQLRKEKRKSRLMLIGVILLMAVTTTAYFVFYAIPLMKNAQRHRHHNSPTNSPAVSLPQRQTNQPNHE